MDVPLAKIGGKGLFVKEIEDALLSKEIDLAVHSMKDVPTALPEGLEILCVPPREDPRDALITHEGCGLDQLKPGASIGTSSLRRQAQLLHYRPDFIIEMLRGNLDTRLRKLREGQFDAIVLAAAGLQTARLGLRKSRNICRSTSAFPRSPRAPLALKRRSDDTFVRELLSRFEHPPTRITVTAERALLHRLEGGCQVPIAAHAVLEGDTLRLMVGGQCGWYDASFAIRSRRGRLRPFDSEPRWRNACSRMAAMSFSRRSTGRLDTMTHAERHSLFGRRRTG